MYQPLPGTLGIGVVAVKMQPGQDASNPEVASSIRATLMEYLKGPTVDAIVLDEKSPANVSIEAGQKECDFVVYASLSKKTKTSLFGSLIKAAVPVFAGQAPVDGTETSNSQGAIAQSGKEFVSNVVTSKFAAKDELTLDFILVKIDGGAALLKASASAKLKIAGEDVIPTLIEQAAEKLLQTALKK